MTMLTRTQVTAQEPGHSVDEWIETAGRLAEWVEVFLSEEPRRYPSEWECCCPCCEAAFAARAWLDGQETEGGEL